VDVTVVIFELQRFGPLPEHLAFASLHFTSHENPLGTARWLNARRTDVIVDTMGWVANKQRLLAHRPARANVMIIYPLTSGSKFVDLIAVDKIVAPPEYAAHFAEALLVMPRCYSPNHHMATFRGGAPQLDGGQSAGGNRAFVTARARKLDREIVDLWISVVKLAGAELYWNDFKDVNVTLLRAYVERGGLARDRLFLMQRGGYEDYIARLGAMDLNLDARRHSGHSTSFDSIFAGDYFLCPSSQPYFHSIPLFLKIDSASSEWS
jgi:protein O-GlcNAc transferase